MVYSVISVVLVSFCVIQVIRACDKKTLSKIDALRKGVDDSGFMEKLPGSYTFVFAAFGNFSSKFTGKCLEAEFDKGEVSFKGLASGKYGVEYKNGNIIFLDDKKFPVWTARVLYTSPSLEVITLFACASIDIDPSNPSFTGIAVKKSALSDSSGYVEEAKATLVKVGIKDGVVLSSCA